MAYIANQITDATAVTANTYTAPMPTHEVGDLLLMSVTYDQSIATGLIAIPAGWTLIGTQGVSGAIRNIVIYTQVTSIITDVPFSFVTAPQLGHWTSTTLVIREFNTTTPIDASLQTAWNLLQDVTMSGLSTTTNDCLVLYIASSDLTSGTTDQIHFNQNSCIAVDRIQSGALCVTGYRNQYTAGAVPAVDWRHTTAAEGGYHYIIAIRNSAGGTLMPESTYAFTRIRKYGTSFTPASWGHGASVPTLTALNSISINSTPMSINPANLNMTEVYGQATSIFSNLSTTSTWLGAIDTLPSPVNLDNKIISWLWQINSYSAATWGNEGYVVVFFDGSDNYKAFQVVRKSGIRNNTQNVIHIDPKNTTAYQSFGTIDWTNITRVGHYHHRQGSSIVNGIIIIHNFVINDPVQIIGGGLPNPVNPLFLGKVMNGHGYAKLADVQGSGQGLNKQGVQIGNGTSRTYADFTATSYETPQSNLSWRGFAQRAPFRIIASAADTFIFDSSILATTTVQPFTIDASSSLSATYSFLNASIIGWDVTWRAGLACNGPTFSKCGILTMFNSAISNVTVNRSRSTTSAMVIQNGASLTNVNFTKASETYAIDVSQAGTYDFSNVTFNGYTTQLNVTATTGVVNINVLSGVAPTFVTAGATVNIIAGLRTITLTNLIVGSRYRIERQSDKAMLAEGTAVSSTANYTYTYLTDVPVNIIVRKASAAPKYLPFSTQATLGDANSSVFVNLIQDTIAS